MATRDRNPQPSGSLRELALALREEGLSSVEIATRTGTDPELIDRLTGHALDDPTVVMFTPSMASTSRFRALLSGAALEAARQLAEADGGFATTADSRLIAIADEIMDLWLEPLLWRCFPTQAEWLAGQVSEGIAP